MFSIAGTLGRDDGPLLPAEQLRSGLISPIGPNAWTWNSRRFTAFVFWTEPALGPFHSGLTLHPVPLSLAPDHALGRWQATQPAREVTEGDEGESPVLPST